METKQRAECLVTVGGRLGRQMAAKAQNRSGVQERVWDQAVFGSTLSSVPCCMNLDELLRLCPSDTKKVSSERRQTLQKHSYSKHDTFLSFFPPYKFNVA